LNAEYVRGDELLAALVVVASLAGVRSGMQSQGWVLIPIDDGT
jgi:hypothetical protein